MGHLLPVIIVCFVGLGFYYFGGDLNIDSPESGSEELRVEVGGDYYILVSLIEVSAKMPDGGNWDSTDKSPPDLYSEIYWQGHQAFQSSTKDDSLLAVWSETEIDLREIALTGKTTSSDDVVKAARINIKENEKINIKVFDSDLLGQKELILSVDLKTSDLKLGENIYHFKKKGIVRLVVKAIEINKEATL